MTKARSEQVSINDTPYYHCMVRCVRRAYLCGEDKVTGQNYDHRKQWLVSRMRFLSYVYAIDICAYAVMSNHYHMVLHVDEARGALWSDDEVVERWLQLYNGNALVSRWIMHRKDMTKAELVAVAEVVDQWRERLTSISWFMRGMNETIARMANEEDNCTGRFWEGRFKSQALLDEVALLSCMAYVDLNPVRAAMEEDVMLSDYTSIQQRLFDVLKYKSNKNADERRLVKRVKKQVVLKQSQRLNTLPEAPLMPFDGSSHISVNVALPFTREDYFQLVDATGHVIREDKRGYIPERIQPILLRLGIESNQWLAHVKNFGRSYGDCAGSQTALRDFATRNERCWSKGVGASRAIYVLG